MFKCSSCGDSSQPNEKLHREVVETRVAGHPARKYKNKRGIEIHDPGNQFGTQIVREQNVCRTCRLGTVDKLVEKFNHPVDDDRPSKMALANFVMS